MSAPTPAPGDDRPREGYYPDPSIPGYVRYWNGASWVSGTSRPAPKDGESLAPPPGARPSVEETGPHFFDEDPVAEQPPAASQHGSRPEPATAWGADRAGNSGAPDASGRSVAWPGPAQGTDPRIPHARQEGPSADAPAGAGAAASASAARADGRVDAGSGEEEGRGGNTFVFRRPAGGAQNAAAPAPASAPAPAPAPSAEEDEGTMTFRAIRPRSGGPGFAAGKAAADRASSAQAPSPSPSPAPQAPAPQAPAAAPPAVPHQAAAPQPSAPVAAGPGGGQSSWAQQVHRLAGAGGEEQPVVPWKPPVEDVFQAAARRQASARPAGLGKRLAARLIDSVVLAAVTGVAAVPLGTRAVDHVNDKIDQAKLSGETVTVWLLDGTTSLYLGIVLAVLLVFGVVYEALPTAKWGRTLGKRLLGLEVRDIEAHEAPAFGAALRRWLVYSVPGLLAVGVVGVVWCLFDRPWRQCWHDKAAGTFVAG
ncbi:RDD family protein [Streptomyces sp. DZ1-3]|uniref:RDD family protein n=1 Tax=Streptomyces sp. DZ1-3 TaxID=3417466 RepID=UPI003CF2C12D